MDLTTLATVRARVGYDAGMTDDDAVIAELITSVSGRVETMLARHTEAIERTEDYRLDPGGRLVLLEGYPASAVAEVKLSIDGTFTEDALVEGTGYRVDLRGGSIRLLEANPYANAELRVTYTGGMGADTATFITNYPGLAGAVATQVVNELQRRRTPGGEVAYQGGGTQVLGAVRDVPELRDQIDAHRRNY